MFHKSRCEAIEMTLNNLLLELHNQMPDMVYRNIWAELDVKRSKWDDRAEIMWDFQIQTLKLVKADEQLDMIVVENIGRKLQ